MPHLWPKDCISFPDFNPSYAKLLWINVFYDDLTPIRRSEYGSAHKDDKSLPGENDVSTSFWLNHNIIITPCVCCGALYVIDLTIYDSTVVATLRSQRNS